jgi:single-stranded-DNA-specific exonuclease
LLIALPAESDNPAAHGQGSGRSVAAYPLHEGLRACEEHLLSHGGHHMAAGFRIRPDKIEAFRASFCDHAVKYFPNGPPSPRLILEAETPLSSLTLGLLKDLDRLEPYGSANARPLFLAGGLQIVGEPRTMGNGNRHLHFRVRQGQTQLRAVAWGMAERVEALMSAEGQCCLAFNPRVNDWHGYRSIELEVTDFQPGPRATLS